MQGAVKVLLESVQEVALLQHIGLAGQRKFMFCSIPGLIDWVYQSPEVCRFGVVLLVVCWRQAHDCPSEEGWVEVLPACLYKVARVCSKLISSTVAAAA